MNCLLSFVAIVLVTIVIALDSEDNRNIKTIDWTDCGGSNATVRWEEVKIHEPIRLKQLMVGARYRILEEVKPGSTSTVEVWRLMKVLFVPVQIKIPCTNKFGSCDLDICRVADYDNFCTFQNKHNASCGCPMTPKVVEGYNYMVKVPERKMSTFQSLFAEGAYRIRWTWFNPKGEKIGCLNGQGTLKPF